MQREKNDNMDFLRAMACVMVVCIHVTNYYSRGYGEISNASYIFSIIVNGVCRLAVPLFFMISGFLLLPEVLTIKKSIRRAFRTFCVLVLWSGIYYIWNLFYRNRGYDFIQSFEEPVKKHLWFLYAILGMYVALPFLQCMMKNMPDLLMRYFALLWFGFMALDFVTALLNMEITYEVPLVGGSCYLGYFIMGFIISHTTKKVKISKWVCYTGAMLCIGVIVFATYVGTIEAGEHNEVFFEYRNVLIAIAASLIFYDASQNGTYVFKERTKKIVSLLARHSFTIYLCHVLFLDIVKLEFYPREVSAWIGIPVYTMAIFVASLLFSVIWSRMYKGLRVVIGKLKKRGTV